MEVLSSILRSIRAEGSVYFCDQVVVPWTKEFTNTDSANFHLIRQGNCWATIDDQIEHLSAGDLIFLGPGVDHTISNQSNSKDHPNFTDDTLLLCGYCRFSDTNASPLLDVFPTSTIVRKEEFDQHPWLKRTFDQLGDEYMAQQPGSALIVDKLTEVILVELIRINFGRETRHPFLEALNDKRISRALHQLHNELERNWTLETLAEEIGMSRAAFAKRFTELVGQPMFSYLTSLRMQKAKKLLRESRLPVYEIANHTGYESDRAFTNAFKKQVGTTPNRFRNQK